jgi:hypothetical protein
MFLNTSNHTLSFPKPVLFCHKMPGTVVVVSKFKPFDPHSEQSRMGMGCGACQVSTRDILEQAQDWMVLGPGQIVGIPGRLSDAMIIGAAGTYQLHVTYSSPSFNAQDQKKLRAAGIHLPSSGDYDSDSVTFEIAASQPDAD